MPTSLKRYYGAGYLHFITFSCYRRRPLLARAHRRDLLLRILEQARRSYRFVVVGYVVMPEHVHLLISEPVRGTPSTVLQVVKQRFAHQLLTGFEEQPPSPDTASGTPLDAGHIWQKRFYDFVVWNPKKRVEKLRYMHHNPVKRGLVQEPGQWEWSSYGDYAYDEKGPVLLNEQTPAVMNVRPGIIADRVTRVTG
jgi:putative transposase